MGVREQIMALTVYDDLEFDLRRICADIAEANEKELLAEIEAIKSCADAFEFDASVRKAIIEKQQAEKAALIAELRELDFMRINSRKVYLAKDVFAILAKYEANP